MFQLALAVVISCYFFLARMSLYQSAHQTFLTSLDTVKRHYSTEIVSQLDGTQISHLYYLLSSTDVILSSIDEILCLNSRRAMKTSLEEIYDHEILRTVHKSTLYQLFLMLPYQFDACQITAFDDINGKERRDSCAADNFFPLSYAQMKQEPGDYPLEYLEALEFDWMASNPEPDMNFSEGAAGGGGMEISPVVVLGGSRSERLQKYVDEKDKLQKSIDELNLQIELKQRNSSSTTPSFIISLFVFRKSYI